MSFESFHSSVPESSAEADLEPVEAQPAGLQNEEYLDSVIELDQRTGDPIVPNEIAEQGVTAIYLGHDKQWRVSTRPRMAADRQKWP